MNIKKNYIPINHLCSHYKVKMSFFNQLNDFGLIEMITIEETYHIHEDKISDVEKIIRMYKELGINFEGIDIILNLLQRNVELQLELDEFRNKLNRYEQNK